MALLPDAAAFYTWVAATWVFTASVVVAIVRCWTRGRGLRVEYVFTGFRAPLVLVTGLLSQVSLRLYTVHVSIPQPPIRSPRAPAALRGHLPLLADGVLLCFLCAMWASNAINIAEMQF